MKTIVRNFRIFVASIFLEIGQKIDCRDAEDWRASMRRLDPDFEKASHPKETIS